MKIITEKNSVQGNVQKNELKSNIKKISLISLVAVFIILGLALIVSGSSGALPLLPTLIPGIVLILSAGILLTGRFLTTTKGAYDYKIGSLKFNRRLFEKADKWCRKESERRLLITDKTDPDHIGNNFFHKNSEVKPSLPTIHRICYQDHPEAFRLICEFREHLPPNGHVGVIVGCYVVLIQSLLQIRQSISEIPRSTRGDNPAYKGLPAREKIPYLLDESAKGTVSPLIGIQSGAAWLFRSYMALRTGATSVNGPPAAPVPEEEFLKPGTDYHFVRELFNDARRAILSVFSLKDLRKYVNGPNGYTNHTMKFICDMCEAADNGKEFLTIHENYEFCGRDRIEMFCN